MTTKGIRAFSAPGKALIAGGYLVLDAQYNAYVTALSSRMHAIIKSEEVVANSETSFIKIKSPQFEQGEWEYEIKDNVIIGNENKNPFIESTIRTILSYFEPTVKYDLNITIFSDPGYHSQQDTSTKQSHNGNKQFLYHKSPITEVAKTGLGSSAGLVTVITTVLVSVFQTKELTIDNEITMNKIHNLAQISHCLAQKKIGSGFDIATAVYGSIIYRRFKPELINDLFDDESDVGVYNEKIKKIVDNKWEFKHERCALPPHIKLLMGDIKGGSETPKLVSKILNWKTQNVEQSDKLYEDLNQSNLNLISVLEYLHEQYHTDKTNYIENLKLAGALQNTTTNTKNIFQPLIDATKQIRINLKKLTIYSGADVEPDSQTQLLDACESLNGCLGGVVPGAGGFDAISLLMVESEIKSLTQQTEKDTRFANVDWLNLHEEADGIIEEKINDYSGLL